MFRKRIAALILTASLATASGCASITEWTYTMFHPAVRCCPDNAACAAPGYGGAALDEGGPYLGAPPMGLPGSPACGAGNGPPRVVPQAAPPTSYSPVQARPGLLSAFEK